MSRYEDLTVNARSQYDVLYNIIIMIITKTNIIYVNSTCSI